MKRLRMGVLACLLALVFALPASASADGENVPKAWGGVGATFGPCGISLPKGVLAVGGNVYYGESNGVRAHDDRVDGSVKTEKLNEILKLRYGIWDGLDIRSSTPYYNVRMQNSKPDKNVDKYGFGDTTVVLHQRLLKQSADVPFSLGLDFGGVIPTGTVSANHSSDPSGYDAWGGLVGLGATSFFGANRIDTEVNYTKFSYGAHQYRNGDRVRWNLGYAYAFNDSWDVGVESSVESMQQSRSKNVPQHDSYTEWYAGPKVIYNYNPWKMHVGLIALMPVTRWYENADTDSKAKKGSDDLRVELKLMKSFDIGSMFN